MREFLQNCTTRKVKVSSSSWREVIPDRDSYHQERIKSTGDPKYKYIGKHENLYLICLLFSLMENWLFRAEIIIPSVDYMTTVAQRKVGR